MEPRGLFQDTERDHFSSPEPSPIKHTPEIQKPRYALFFISVPSQEGTFCPRSSQDSRLNPLKNSRCAHTSADAHRYHAELFVEAVEIMEDLCGEFGAGTA